MKVLDHTPFRLSFRHVPVGMAILTGLVLVIGLVVGGATITMHETLSLDDDFVRLGLAILAATILLVAVLARFAVRVRRLTLDGSVDELRLTSRGLGRAKTRVWPLHTLMRAEVREEGAGEHASHVTVLHWADGTETLLAAMDGPTIQRAERNVRTINEWLAALRQP